MESEQNLQNYSKYQLRNLEPCVKTLESEGSTEILSTEVELSKGRVENALTKLRTNTFQHSYINKNSKREHYILTRKKNSNFANFIIIVYHSATSFC